jgi:excisionase family DNA binding protein
MTVKASVFFPPNQYSRNEVLLPAKNTVTTVEAAQILGCSRQQVYNYIEEGSLNALDISRKSPLDPGSARRHVRVVTASIKDFFEARQTLRNAGCLQPGR